MRQLRHVHLSHRSLKLVHHVHVPRVFSRRCTLRPRRRRRPSEGGNESQTSPSIHFPNTLSRSDQGPEEPGGPFHEVQKNVLRQRVGLVLWFWQHSRWNGGDLTAERWWIFSADVVNRPSRSKALTDTVRTRSAGLLSPVTGIG